MSLHIDKERCTSCGACVEACPFGAMEMGDDGAWANDQCTLCGACEESCPVEAISIDRKTVQVQEGYSGVWVFCEQRHGRLAGVSFELLGEGRRLADKLGVELSAVLFGHEIEDQTPALFEYGADRLFLAEDPELAGFTDDEYGSLLLDLVREHRPEILLCGATAVGRSFFPKVACALSTGLTADCTSLDVRSSDRLLLQTRPAFGGNIMATILCPSSRPQMATVRPRVMKRIEPIPGRKGILVRVERTPENDGRRCRLVRSVEELGEKLNLAEAEVIVAGGRGLGSAEGFRMLGRLAELLGGVLGATRGAVDAGWLPYAHQIGQTGKTVAPKLYVACGISGAVQHLVGMQSSDTIVAINSDPGAPIFDVATIGLVGDVHGIVPALIQSLETRFSG